MMIKTLVKSMLAKYGFEVKRTGFDERDRYSTRFNLDMEFEEELDRETRKVLNLLHYTKGSGTAYNASRFDSAYHSITIDGKDFAGQRKPEKRLADVPYDFTDKVVLDIGCNQGGMLFCIADKIRQGIGVDYDARMINAANRLGTTLKTNNIHFYVFNLLTERLDIIDNFLPENQVKVDIVFLLSVCLWLNNWRDVIDKASSLADCLLFESNGTEDQQRDQREHLVKTYKEVQRIRDTSPDDPINTSRELYLCNDVRV